MQQALLNGVTLEFESAGHGDPVLYVHGALIADAFGPLLAQPALHGTRSVTYHRRGYHGSTIPDAALSVEDHAADAIALVRHLGLEKVHLVGHSYGGAVAVQVVLSAPGLVQSFALLEPAIVMGPSRAAYIKLMADAKRRVESGDAEGTIHDFWTMRFGSGYKAWLDEQVPGVFDASVEHAPTAFSFETIGLADWQFNENLARRIEQPVLLVLGEESPALWSRFQETHDMLKSWLPNVEEYILPRATHAMQMQNPGDLAVALAAFFDRHPLPAR